MLVGFTATSALATVTVPAGYQEGSFSLTVTGTEGTRVRQATTQILVDLTPPVASGPAAAPAYKYSLSSRVPVRATWAPAIDQSRIKTYEVQHSMDWGPWSATWSVAGSALSTIRWVEPNHSHRFRVRALDAAGNWSDWATGPVLRLGVIDDHAYAMRNGPGWSHVADTGSWADTLTRATTNEAGVTIRTAGRQLALVAEVGPSGGWLEITVNGYYQNRVTLLNRTTVKGRVLWIKEFPEDVPMVVELKAVTAGSRTAVNVDALLVGR